MSLNTSTGLYFLLFKAREKEVPAVLVQKRLCILAYALQAALQVSTCCDAVATCAGLYWLSTVSGAEYDRLLPQDTELAQKTNVPDVFGATTEDTNGLRIVSLHEVMQSRTVCVVSMTY